MEVELPTLYRWTKRGSQQFSPLAQCIQQISRIAKRSRQAFASLSYAIPIMIDIFFESYPSCPFPKVLEKVP